MKKLFFEQFNKYFRFRMKLLSYSNNQQCIMDLKKRIIKAKQGKNTSQPNKVQLCLLTLKVYFFRDFRKVRDVVILYLFLKAAIEIQTLGTIFLD